MPDVFMPRLSDTMTEGRISSWLKHEGEVVERGEVIAEIETDKATMDLESYESGVLTRILVPAGATAQIGEPVAVIGAQPDTAEPVRPTDTGAVRPPPTPQPSMLPRIRRESTEQAPILATPLVRRLAQEHGLDLATVTGSGPHGRIVRADVEPLLGHHEPEAAGAIPPPPPPQPPTTAPAPEDVEVPLNNIQRITAERLSTSAAVPHFHLTVAVDAGPLLRLRTDLNEEARSGPDRCSVNDLLLRAVALTLAEHREVNASWADGVVIRHEHVNVGVAVSLDAGLIVPVVHDADRKTVAQITAETRAMTSRARTGRLTPDEFSGGTFTVSNLGMFAIDQFTAVINPPQAAILAVGSAIEEPVARGGKVVIQPTMRLTLTNDHRVLDGATSATFLHDLVQYLEHPLRLLT